APRSTLVSDAAAGPPALSADHRWLAFASAATDLVPNDTNNLTDVFLYDTQTATMSLVSAGPGGVQANDESFTPTISADGRWIAFVSLASNLVPDDANLAPDVFVYDRQTGTTTRASVGVGGGDANGFQVCVE